MTFLNSILRIPLFLNSSDTTLVSTRNSTGNDSISSGFIEILVNLELGFGITADWLRTVGFLAGGRTRRRWCHYCQ